MTRPSAREIGDELSVRRVVLKISCSRECLQRERNIFQHSHCRSDRIGLSGRLVDSELLVLLLLESSIGLISTLPAEPPFQLGDSKASQMIPEEVLPGAGFNFQDVTKIFTDAASGKLYTFSIVPGLHGSLPQQKWNREALSSWTISRYTMRWVPLR